MRRALLAAGLVGLSIGVPAGTQSARASVPVLVIDGRGYGHGVGMAQDGALWMGVAGANLSQIIGHFYPGTSFGKSSGTVRVGVMRSDSGDATLQFPDGGEVRDAPSGDQSPGFPIDVPPGGQARVWWDGGRYHALYTRQYNLESNLFRNPGEVEPEKVEEAKPAKPADANIGRLPLVPA